MKEYYGINLLIKTYICLFNDLWFQFWGCMETNVDKYVESNELLIQTDWIIAWGLNSNFVAHI